MLFSDMQAAINRIIDDTLDTPSALQWLNEGKDIMAHRGEYLFPDITSTATDTFAFPAKYHSIPVLHAAQRALEQAVMLDQAKSIEQQFEMQISYFLQNYQCPPQYWDDDLTEQFTASVNGQLAFVIVKNSYDRQTGNLRVYVNNRESSDFCVVRQPATNPADIITTTMLTNDPNGFVFNPTTTLALNDLVTARWEEHSDWVDSPYPWQRW